MSLPYPDDKQASQFAVMLDAGLTATQAILYFIESEDPGYLASIAARWERSRAVKQAIKSLMGKDWHEMSTSERIAAALDRTYNQMAAMLISVHYAEANPQEKQKLDEARKSLEAKVAGTAGKADPFQQFMADLNSGKLKLAQPVIKAAAIGG